MRSCDGGVGMTGSVSDRMAEIFDPEPRLPNRQIATIAGVSHTTINERGRNLPRPKVAMDTLDRRGTAANAAVRPESVDPALDPEIAERIRALLREGDFEAAAAYAEMVMASVGIPGPELQTGAQADADSDRSEAATDARDEGEQAGTTASWLPRTTTAGPTAARGPGERFDDTRGGHSTH